MSPATRVLVVDDSVVIRRLLSNIIDADPDLEVAGIAQNGRIAIERARQLRPDIITLDIEMPELDGIGALRLLRAEFPRTPVVMFSTLTARGAEATLTALSLGAADYVTKPANVGSVQAGMDRVRDDLVPKLKALCRPSVVRPMPVRATPIEKVAETGRVDIVAIGSSTGGPNALAEVLERLPCDLAVPVVVVQHMPPVFTSFLAKRLDEKCHLRVVEATHGMELRPGQVYIAPGDQHLTVARRAAGCVVELDQTDPVHFCRPAVDRLFGSVAEVYGGDVLAVVLTGMGADGRDGCIPLKERGAHVIAQDKATSVVWGMPGAVVAADLADEVLPLAQIAAAIVHRASRPARSDAFAAR